MGDSTKVDRAEKKSQEWQSLTDEEYWARCEAISKGLKKRWKKQTPEEREAINQKKRETWKRKAAEALAKKKAKHV